MQITVEIPDDLAAQVRARGLTPESYVKGLIDSARQSASTEDSPARRRTDLETFLREMARHSEKIAKFPDEALTRESFHQDHD
jgi:hypothetical protein